MKVCKEEGCTHPVLGRGMCNLHYKRWYRALGKEPAKPAIAEVIAKYMPGSIAAMAKAAGYSEPGVAAALKKLKAKGGCHIEKWQRSHQGAISAIYAAGPGEDAVCTIKPFTPQQLAKRSVRNRKRDGRWEERKAKDRMRHWVKKAQTRPNTWLGALGVPP